MGERNENLVYPPRGSSIFLLHAVKSYDMGPSGLLPIRSKVCCGFLSPVEIYHLSRVRTRNLWGPVASTLTTTPPRRHYTRTPSISLDSSVMGRYGRAIAQAVSRGFSSRRLGFAPRSVHRICGEQSGSRIGFPLSSFVFPRIYRCTAAPYSLMHHLGN
jgi:hypothetical protein